VDKTPTVKPWDVLLSWGNTKVLQAKNYFAATGDKMISDNIYQKSVKLYCEALKHKKDLAKLLDFAEKAKDDCQKDTIPILMEMWSNDSKLKAIRSTACYKITDAFLTRVGDFNWKELYLNKSEKKKSSFFPLSHIFNQVLEIVFMRYQTLDCVLF